MLQVNVAKLVGFTVHVLELELVAMDEPVQAANTSLQLCR